MPLYQITDWDAHFENHKSRDVDDCTFVALPNKQHGMGFIRIMALPDGAAIFGVWCLIAQAASRQKRPRAGWLTDDGTQTGLPWEAEDMALIWRRPIEEIQRALDVLASPKIGWIKAYTVAQDDSQPTAGEAPPDRRPAAGEAPPSRRPTAAQPPPDRRQPAGEAPPECRPAAAEVSPNRPRMDGMDGRDGMGKGADPPPPEDGQGDTPQAEEIRCRKREALARNREALGRLLRRLGLRASEATLTEWGDLMQGRGGCKTIDEMLEGITWIMAKPRGNGIEYAKNAAELADQWCEKLEERRRFRARTA